MKVKAIGKYGRFAPFGEANNCYLLQTDGGKNIVIDFGAGALAGLQKYIKISEIDCIILTHLHFDHASDIGVLSYAAGFLGLDKIKIYMPRTPMDMVNILSSSKFDITFIDNLQKIVIDKVEITCLSSPHPVETYALKICQSGKTLVYTSDCSNAEAIKSNMVGADVVIGDACILDKNWKNVAPHISVKQLAEFSPKNARLYLAHLTIGEEQETLEEAKQYHSNAELVYNFDI